MLLLVYERERFPLLMFLFFLCLKGSGTWTDTAFCAFIGVLSVSYLRLFKELVNLLRGQR